VKSLGEWFASGKIGKIAPFVREANCAINSEYYTMKGSCLVAGVAN